MREIKKYNNAGQEYNLIHTDGEFRIFEAKNPSGWEVVKIRKFKKNTLLNGEVIHFEGDEYIPKPCQWGMYGWTALSLEHAHEILKSKMTT